MKTPEAATIKGATMDGFPTRWLTLAILFISGVIMYGFLDIRLSVRPTILKQLNSFSLNLENFKESTKLNATSASTHNNTFNVAKLHATVKPETVKTNLPKKTPTTKRKIVKTTKKKVKKATVKKSKTERITVLKIKRIKRHELQNQYREVLLDLLRTFMKIAEELKLVWFAYGGTLIGTWRHHGFVPWDDDVDILVNNSQKPALLKKFLTMEPAYVGHDGKPIIKMFSNRSSVKIKDSGHRWPFIDILFFEEKDGKIWDNIKGMDKYKVKMTDMFPVHKRPFDNLMINAPKRPLKLLLLQYQWVKPDRCSTWNYSHRLEKMAQKRVEVKCEALRDIYPFVHREYVAGNNSMKETLKVGSKVIHTKYVKEEKSSLTPPYSLKPVK